MTCDTVREKLADPSSVGRGHGAVAQHLQTCETCRETARQYSAIGRLYNLDSAGEQPADFDGRVLARLAETVAAPPRRLSPAALAILSLAAIALLVTLTLARRRPVAPPATALTVPTAAPSADDAPTSEPAPEAIPEEEKARVAALHPFDFLRFAGTLAALDPFFPADAMYGPPMPGASRLPPPVHGDELMLRLLSWRRLPAAEREKLETLERGIRALPEDRQDALLRRWKLVGEFSAEEKSGLRRLAGRLSEMDSRQSARLRSDLRAAYALSPVNRVARWRSLPFAKGLTGQELAAGERLLSS